MSNIRTANKRHKRAHAHSATTKPVAETAVVDAAKPVKAAR